MRVVFDTNVLVAALLWRGVPHQLLQRVRDGDVVLVTSPKLLEELDDVLRRTKFAAVLTKAETSAAGLLSTVRLLAALIELTSLGKGGRTGPQPGALRTTYAMKPRHTILIIDRRDDDQGNRDCHFAGSRAVCTMP